MLSIASETKKPFDASKNKNIVKFKGNTKSKLRRADN